MKYPEITRLYKYRTFSCQTLKMLARNEIYFAASHCFNDPFECRARKEFEFKSDPKSIKKMAELEVSQSNQKISLEQAMNYIEEIASDPQKIKKYLNDKSDFFQRIVLQSFGIYSLSKKRNDILMWSHYSDGHTGFCIEFNRAENNIFAETEEVNYPKDNEFVDVDYLSFQLEKLLEEAIKVVLTKSIHWAYEEEWRIVERLPVAEKNYRGHLRTYTDDMLSGIIFGERMDEHSRKTIMDILNHKPVHFYEAKRVKNKFEIEIKPVTL